MKRRMCADHFPRRLIDDGCDIDLSPDEGASLLMTDDTFTRRFGLQRVDATSWVIRDAHQPEYAARAVAHITVTEDDQVEVIWAAPLPLPVTFATIEDAVDSLEDWTHRQRGATKPIPIPHFPPPAH